MKKIWFLIFGIVVLSGCNNNTSALTYSEVNQEDLSGETEPNEASSPL
ncbi:membrane lipoprotein lipid attachment site-containing protein [Sutcliffiella horikoshii]